MKFHGKMNITQNQRPPANAPQSKMSRGSNIFVPQNKYFGRYQQAGPQYGYGNHVLTENLQILKAINMNKMQHQYIQNLQKANMTLKCKIKEISQLKTQEDLENFKKQKDACFVESEGKSGDEEGADETGEQRLGSDSDEVPGAAVEAVFEEFLSEDDFQLQEVGTIEELGQKALEKRRKRAESRNLSAAERKFYDRNSIGRRERRYQPKNEDDNTTHKDNESEVPPTLKQQSSYAGSSFGTKYQERNQSRGKKEVGGDGQSSYQQSYYSR